MFILLRHGLLGGAVMLGSMSFAFAHGVTDDAKQRMAEGGYLDYVWIGAEHMLTGYDHLLFLFGVIFFLTRFIDILKFVTAFTVGHVITLVFATYLGITADFHLIDAVIALTVAYKGFENLDGFRRYLSTASPNLMAMVFAFGLIHGFGLATRLQQLTLADDPQLLGKILAFNVGVELGQVAALSVMALGIVLWRRRPSWTVFSKVANGGLIAAGALLLIMQLHGFSHTAHADEFPINRADHAHAHEDAAAASEAHTHDGTTHSHGGETHSHDGDAPPHDAGVAHP